MADNDYHFITTWRVENAALAEVTEILGNAEDLPRWWPSVYLDVKIVEPGGPDGVGRLVELYTKGWLPYTLRWSFRVKEATATGSTIEAFGDFVGRGIWTFTQDGDAVIAKYDWKIRADKPLLRRLSRLLKPLFSANHHWAMARGEESLRLELMRRRATSDEARAAVPPPPAPTFQFLL
jgi:hypothetical protein